jgi:hypothetical protein
MWAFVQLIYLRIRRSIAEARTEIAWLKALEKREAELDEHYASYQAHAADAKKRGASQPEVYQIQAEELHLAMPLQDEIAATETWHLVEQARRYGIPTPPVSNETPWESDPLRRLTEEARSDLRGKVAAVKREQRESAAKLLNALTPLTALLVALATVIATCHTRSQ